MNQASNQEEITLDDGTEDYGDISLEDSINPSQNICYQTSHGISHKIGYAVGWIITTIILSPLRIIGLFRKKG